MKFAEVAPEVTVTVVGRTALELLDVRLTMVPDNGAGPLSVTVPFAWAPPTTDAGETARAAGTGGRIVRVAVTVPAPIWAVIVTAVLFETGLVVAENVAELDPAATVTPVGADAFWLDDERLTSTPPVGAGPESVTAPVAEVPPVTDVGEKVRVERTGALTVRTAVAEVLPTEAVIVGAVLDATGVVVIWKVAAVAPAATVTVAGVTALGSLEDKATLHPPVGAGAVKVTVPVEEVPPVTVLGARVKEEGAGGTTVKTVVTTAFCALAVIVADVAVVTGDVEMVKDAEMPPAGTVTVVGGTATVLFEDRLITEPPVGAGTATVT